MSLMQSYSEVRPPKPTLTEEHIPDLSGKVLLLLRTISPTSPPPHT